MVSDFSMTLTVYFDFKPIRQFKQDVLYLIDSYLPLQRGHQEKPRRNQVLQVGGKVHQHAHKLMTSKKKCSHLLKFLVDP